MPISNYYTGSSSTVSATIARSPRSPYQYTHYNSQAENNMMPSSSIQDKVLKTSSSNNKSVNGSIIDADDSTAAAEERLAKQLQMALLQSQILALQQYRSPLFGSNVGQGLAGYSGYQYGFPNTMSSLYNYLAGPDTNLELLPTTSASSISSAKTGERENIASATNGKESRDPLNDPLSLSDEAQLQALVSMINYRQQLSSMYGGHMFGNGMGPGYSSNYGSGSGSSMYGNGNGFGLSTLFGSGYGNGMGSSLSSLYGSAMPTGAGGVLSSLAGGLSSLTGGGGGIGG
ncbi:hypothetical protein BLA29_008894, partial [Euroglyphus maynei]